MTTHTPGPWELDQPGGFVIKGCGDEIAFTARTDDFDNALPAEANARLIAAAPTLLLELQKLIERCDGEEGIQPDGSNMETSLAHAAIKLALGERER